MKAWRILGGVLALAGFFSLNLLVGREVDETYNLIAMLCGAAVWTGLLILWSTRPWIVLLSSLLILGGLWGFFALEKFPLLRAQLLIGGIVLALFLLLGYAFEPVEKKKKKEEKKKKE